MQNVKSKIKNFIYYYKWYMLIALFFIVFITVMVVQMVTKDEFDIKLLYAGPEILSESEENKITDALCELGKDYNGDGDKICDLFNLIIMDEQQLNAAYDAGQNPYFLNMGVINENRDTLTFHAMANEYTLLLLSPENYELLRKHNMLVSLESLGYEEPPIGAKDEYSVYINQLEIAEFYRVFRTFPEDTVLCVKRISTNKDGESREGIAQKNHIELFKKMVEFKLPDDYVAPEDIENAQGDNVAQ